MKPVKLLSPKERRQAAMAKARSTGAGVALGYPVAKVAAIHLARAKLDAAKEKALEHGLSKFSGVTNPKGLFFAKVCIHGHRFGGGLRVALSNYLAEGGSQDFAQTVAAKLKELGEESGQGKNPMRFAVLTRDGRTIGQSFIATSVELEALLKKNRASGH